MISAIGRVRIEHGFTIEDAAEEVQATFGEGGNGSGQIPETIWLGFIGNSPMKPEPVEL